MAKEGKMWVTVWQSWHPSPVGLNWHSPLQYNLIVFIGLKTRMPAWESVPSRDKAVYKDTHSSTIYYREKHPIEKVNDQKNHGMDYYKVTQNETLS